jgi:hypothetical protein
MQINSDAHKLALFICIVMFYLSLDIPLVMS